ncbi:MAG TPA: ATP-binding protein [Candidatus Dormibacteraeota bacterium]|nr:ATP-binding protein [Candidatus Dormibacteraeota bacterium]
MVADKYYKIYRWFLLASSVGIIIAWAIFNLVPSLKNSASRDGLVLAILISNTISVIYLIAFFNIIGKKFNYWQSTLLGLLIFAFGIAAAMRIDTISHSGAALLCFVIVWLAQMIWSGIFGWQAIVVLNFFAITFVYFGGFSNKYLLLMVFGGLILSVLFQILIWEKLQGKVFDGINRNNKINPLSGTTGESRSSAEGLINSINEGVVVIDKTSRITIFNPTAEALTEWAADDAKNIDVNLVVKILQENGQPFSEQDNPFNSILQTQKKIDTTVQLVNKSGKQIFISLVAAPIIVTGQMTGVAFTMRDITVQRNAEQQKLDFISTASHEMRTPVAAIEGYLSLALNDKTSSIDSRAKGYLEKAHNSTRQLGKLFQDLLNSSKAEDGRLTNHPEVIELSDYISKMAEGFQLAAEQKHLIVNFTLINTSQDQAEPQGKIITPLFFVYVDPSRLMEVLTNLFDNAVKYTETGSITIGLGGTDTDITLSIKDTGVGIPAESIDHLFQKFYRVDNSAVRTIGGTGLGLYISKKIVELYRGRIWAESEVGKGTTFFINLPRLSQQQVETLSSSNSSQAQATTPAINPTV